MTRREAREKIKAAIKDSGGKISHYSAAEITKAARKMVEYAKAKAKA